MMLKGFAILVMCLNLSADALVVRRPNMLTRTMKLAAKARAAQRRRDMSGAMTSHDTLRKLSNLDKELYDDIMEDVAARLIKTFQPDAVMEVMDRLDSVVRLIQDQLNDAATEDETSYDEDFPYIPIPVAR